MGLLWRLFAPKGLKRARRKARKVAHPLHTASWEMSPKPVKQARRAAFKVAHPGEALEFAVENQVVRAVRGGSRTASPVVAADGATSAQVRAWARRQGYQAATGGRLPSRIIDAYNSAHRGAGR
jgi:hypothetical protein